jgi:DNA invertase Pin-like site-specific DNA recombinase
MEQPLSIGYARVSTIDQNLQAQVDALLAAGCQRDRIYTDRVTGIQADRPGLHTALEVVRPGDTLVVWKLDRLARSIKHLIEVVEQLEARQVAFKSLTEGIDTSSAQGRLMLHLFGAFAEFERSLIRERTLAGLEAARQRGRKGGRKVQAPLKQMKAMARLVDSGETTVAEVCRELGIGRTTWYRHIASFAKDTLSTQPQANDGLRQFEGGY